ncbi:MAG: acyltransferase [Flavobacterium psychrophilum]|nr:MAG: acyltransferase [Flavobacterium psychrophilum]
MIKAQSKLNGLDHLRALAILLVLGFHYQLGYFGRPEWTKQFNQFGWTGVDLFFVLSGFLISSQLFAQMNKGKTISLKEFFLKRFFRIIPIYFVVVGIYFCFPFFREKEALPPLWKFLTFTQNFGLDIKHFGTFSHAWSLCVEEHFYLFLPLILILLQTTQLFKKGYLLLVILFVAGFATRLYSWYEGYLPATGGESSLASWTEFVYYPTYNRLDGLLVGVSIAAIYQYLPRAWNKISTYGNHLILVGLVLLTIAYFFCSDLSAYTTSIVGFPFISIGYGFLVMGAVCPASFLYKWNSKITTLIATLSYGIYLSHKGVIHMVQEIFSDWGIDKNGSVMFLICIAFCVLVAWLLRLTIEKPFMKWRDTVLNRKPVLIANDKRIVYE